MIMKQIDQKSYPTLMKPQSANTFSTFNVRNMSLPMTSNQENGGVSFTSTLQSNLSSNSGLNQPGPVPSFGHNMQAMS
jgi:hypothetical protein